MAFGLPASPVLWPRVAWRIARNASIDRRFGALLFRSHRGWHQNSDYEGLSWAFGDRLRPDDVIVDVGCAGGRVLNWCLLHAPANRVIGIEVDPELGSRTAARLAGQPMASVLVGDAMRLLPAEGTVFYLFNPFERASTQAFRDQLAALAADAPARPSRPLVLYYNCEHVDLFENDPSWAVRRLRADDPQFDELALVTWAPAIAAGVEETAVAAGVDQSATAAGGAASDDEGRFVRGVRHP